MSIRQDIPRLLGWLGLVMAVALVVALLGPDIAAAGPGETVARKLKRETVGIAGPLFAAALVVLVFPILKDRAWGRIAVLLLVAIPLAWIVLTPDDVVRTLARAARDLAP